MIIVKALKNSEDGNLSNPELRETMSKYNERLVKAGVRMMAKGLYLSSNGMLISCTQEGGRP